MIRRLVSAALLSCAAAQVGLATIPPADELAGLADRATEGLTHSAPPIQPPSPRPNVSPSAAPANSWVSTLHPILQKEVRANRNLLEEVQKGRKLPIGTAINVHRNELDADQRLLGAKHQASLLQQQGRDLLSFNHFLGRVRKDHPLNPERLSLEMVPTHVPAPGKEPALIDEATRLRILESGKATLIHHRIRPAWLAWRKAAGEPPHVPSFKSDAESAAGGSQIKPETQAEMESRKRADSHGVDEATLKRQRT